MKLLYTLLICCAVISFNCQNQLSGENGATQSSSHDYPPSPGFNLDNSDVEAIALADEVMNAMGGYANWKATRYISWTFLSGRKLLWDKWEGDVRIDIPKYIGRMPLEEDSVTILLNIHDSIGRASILGEEITDEIQLQELMNTGVSIWINDSYWLVMPFKLKDSGVTLKYLGDRPTAEDSTKIAEVMQLTFEDVGETPDHKYLVYVDKESKLVCQWDFFGKADNELANFNTPWTDYQTYGSIKLSGNRGRAELSNIEVLEEVDKARFEEF